MSVVLWAGEGITQETDLEIRDLSAGSLLGRALKINTIGKGNKVGLGRRGS